MPSKIMDDATIEEILAPTDRAEEKRREERVRSRIWRTARRAARQVPFLDEVLAAYFCAMDPHTPTRVRGILLAALAYFVLPLDTIPDFLAGFGFTDDIAVLTAAFGAVRSHITDAHRRAAREALEEA
jgi:uncharacterized membrane protein YkvA (DUF1232 family)